MKKLMVFLSLTVLILGISMGANAANYTLTFNEIAFPDNDAWINDGTGGSFTVTGTSTATSSSIFDSAALSVVIDIPCQYTPTAGEFKAWIDSARGLGYQATGISIIKGEQDFLTNNYDYTVTFNFPNLNYFGTSASNWWANSLVLGISDSVSRDKYVDSASLTVTYHTPEPTTMFFLGCGLLGLVGLKRRFIK
jgi:hypothetical protein